MLKVPSVHWSDMNKPIEDLQREMEAAASALDFEKARQIRDRINLVRGGATPADAEQTDTSNLVRQRPGAMGLGTNHHRQVPPPNWKPPRKPDPMTSGRRLKASDR